MRLSKLAYEPSSVLEFYADALTTLGALCERTWHDRLCVVADGAALKFWDSTDAIQERELHFVAPDTRAPRDATREVFPGCPWTFRLADALLPSPPVVERGVLRPFDGGLAPPPADMAARLWCSQYPGSSGWRLDRPFQLTRHLSLLAWARCEVQASDQHWSLHRLALNLATGESDDALANALEFAELDPQAQVDWPRADWPAWYHRLTRLLEAELATDLAAIRGRQQRYLERELDRIEDYFQSYVQELQTRLERTTTASSRERLTERLAAADAERERRRQDQVHRHEIRVIPHWDAFLLLAEPAWDAEFTVIEHRETQVHRAAFVPRLRTWFACLGSYSSPVPGSHDPIRSRERQFTDPARPPDNFPVRDLTATSRRESS